MSNSAAGANSIQFGARNCLAWTLVFPKLLKIQPFVWNGTTLAGQLSEKATGWRLSHVQIFADGDFSYPKKVTSATVHIRDFSIFPEI